MRQIQATLTTLRRCRDKALLRAISRESHRTVKCLLRLGADPNVLGWCELGLVSALSAACVRENPELVDLLLRHGAEITGHPHEPTMPYERVCDPAGSDRALACAERLAATWAK